MLLPPAAAVTLTPMKISRFSPWIVVLGALAIVGAGDRESAEDDDPGRESADLHGGQGNRGGRREWHLRSLGGEWRV